MPPIMVAIRLTGDPLVACDIALAVLLVALSWSATAAERIITLHDVESITQSALTTVSVTARWRAGRPASSTAMTNWYPERLE